MDDLSNKEKIPVSSSSVLIIFLLWLARYGCLKNIHTCPSLPDSERSRYAEMLLFLQVLINILHSLIQFSLSKSAAIKQDVLSFSKE